MEYKLSLDHLEVFFWWNNIFRDIEIEKTLFKINDTNTSAWYIDYTLNDKNLRFKYSLVTPTWYLQGFKFETVFEWEIIDLFHVSFWDSSWTIKTRNKITFYSSFLVSYWPDFIFDFIQDFFIDEYIDWLRRFDIALDLPENKQNLIKTFKKIPSSEIGWNREEKERETIYFWNRKNKTTLVRIYDKIKDTLKKWKSFLYDFWDAENVTRVEIEFWLNFIKWVNREIEILKYWSLLLDSKTLRDVFFSRINDYLWYFSQEEFLKNYKMVKYTPRVDNVDNYFLKYWQLPSYHKKVVERCWKYIKMLWLEQFLSIVYSWLEDNEIIDIFDNFFSSYRFRIKNRISKKYKDIKKKNFKEKNELTEEILSYLFDYNQDLSDELAFELWVTFDKFKKRNNL